MTPGADHTTSRVVPVRSISQLYEVQGEKSTPLDAAAASFEFESKQQ